MVGLPKKHTLAPLETQLTSGAKGVAMVVPVYVWVHMGQESFMLRHLSLNVWVHIQYKKISLPNEQPPRG